MVRYLGPKNRVARRFGMNVFGRTRSPLAHKAHPPGMHGAKRKKKSDYGLQLEEKQKLKTAFGMISECQLVHYYKEAVRQHKNTPEILLQKLECRLDVMLFRLKFAANIFHAQQLVSHGHVLVNGRKVDRRSFQVAPGMKISIREKSRQNKAIREALTNPNRAVPSYLAVDESALSGQLMNMPSLEEISLPIEVNVHTVCDFLAHKG